ncbi:hypothetical protein B0H13DRAFT_2309331 [Mycena leptocephala]|nr:hypothetical protein B0H13DRAFT_2309331 [Mycena leptocephala]
MLGSAYRQLYISPPSSFESHIIPEVPDTESFTISSFFCLVAFYASRICGNACVLYPLATPVQAPILALDSPPNHFLFVSSGSPLMRLLPASHLHQRELLLPHAPSTPAFRSLFLPCFPHLYLEIEYSDVRRGSGDPYMSMRVGIHRFVDGDPSHRTRLLVKALLGCGTKIYVARRREMRTALCGGEAVE